MHASANARQAVLTPIGAQALAARNLELLAAIENTLDGLYADTKLLRAIDDGFREIHQRLMGAAGPIDVDGRTQAALVKASDACARIHRDAQKRHQSAGADPALHPDDGVDDAYDEYLGAVRDVHDTVEALREWIVTHDAVLDPSTGDTHASADALFAAILSGP